MRSGSDTRVPSASTIGAGGTQRPQAVGVRYELLRVLGLGFGIAVVVGGVIGQGIMRTPGIVAGAVPNGLLILALWTLGGFLAMLDAFAIAELGASLPRAGGPYTFAARAFGPLAGTMLGWTDWINGTVTIGFVSVVFAEYLHRLGFLNGLPLGLIGIGLIAGVWAINWIGTRTCGASQSIGTALKGLGLIALVCVLFAAPAASGSSVSDFPPVLTLAAFAIAMRAINTTYGGWNTGVYFCEEMHAPERNIVRATFGGILVVTVLYVLINAAMLHVLTPQQMAGSTLPAADAAAVAFGDASGIAITGLAVLSVVAIANLYMMFLSRIGYAMARDGVLPSLFARVSSTGTPRTALLLTAVAAAGLAATGGYERLIAIGGPTSILINAAVDLTAIRMRYSEPSLPRPFRMPLFPLPALFGFVMNAVLLVALFYEDLVNSLLGVGIVAVIGVAHRMCSVFRARLERP